MRKFTSLMLMLLCAVTTWAGPTDLPKISTVENPIYYTIVNTRSSQPGGLMYYAGDNVGLKDEQAVVIEDKHMFYFTGSHEALYIHNKATGNKLASVSSWTEEGTEWAIGESPKGGGLAIGPKGGLNSNNCINEKNYVTDENTSDFTTWSANDDGSIFILDLAVEYTFPETDKFYTIEAPLFFNKQGVNKGLYVDANGNPGWNTVDLTDKNFYWIPTVNGDGTVALKNLGTEKYLNGTEMSDAAVGAKIKVLGAKQFNIIVNNVTLHANNHGNGANASGNIVSWGGSVGSASAWQFIEKQDPDAVSQLDITYNFTYKGKTLEGYTQTVSTLVGEEYPNITVQFPYGISATKPEGTIAADAATTVTIAVEENLPFAYADSYETITKWYYIQQHSSAGYGKYLQYAETYIEWADATIAVGEADTYTWAFVGNPFNGFKMVNYGAPEDANAVVSNGSGNPSFGAFADATAWNIKASATNADAEHFCFQYPGSNQYMNAQSGKIAFWSSADQGSTMWVTERDLTGLAELQTLIDQVDAAIAAYGQGGTTVGFYTAESIAVLTTKLGEAKAAAEANESAAANTAAQVALQNAVAALETIQPSEGAFYNIVSACTKDHRGGQQVYVNADGGMQFAKVEDNMANGSIGHVFQFVPAGDNKFYIYNVQRGTYMQSVGTATETDAAKAKAVTIKSMGLENRVSITPDGQKQMHTQDAGSKIVGWNENSPTDGSAWIISEVADITALSHSVTVSAAGYSTLCVGYNAAIPAEVKCYVVSSTTNGWAHLEPITGVLPANTPVILENAGEFEFTYSTETPATIETNLLEGSTITKKITDQSNTYYILSIVDNIVGLYPDAMSEIVEGEGENAVSTKTFVNNAFKAYLPVTTTEAALSYGFDFGGTTAIEGIEAVAGEQAIYDLTGRKIEAITVPGLYIINGVKTIVE